MSEQNYKFQMDKKYGYLEKIDVNHVVDTCTDKWFNQTLCKVNDSVLRLGVFNEGDFPLHKHEEDDEVFFVLSGHIIIETENGNFDLKPNEGVCVPKGVMHRPIIKEKAIVLMIENDGIVPLGDE